MSISVCLSVCLTVCLSVCLSLSLSVGLGEIWPSEQAGIFELHKDCTKNLQFLLKMTAFGLPTAAGTALQALLHEHFVTSWKIVGSGENLTFVLRLSPAAIDSDTVTSFAHTHDNKEPPMQCYRRKPPSQIRRDQKRAEERKAKVCQQASDFSSLRLFETPSDIDASRPTDDSTPLLDNGLNTAVAARATRCDSSVLYNDDQCSGVSVTTHAEDKLLRHQARQTLCKFRLSEHCQKLCC